MSYRYADLPTTVTASCQRGEKLDNAWLKCSIVEGPPVAGPSPSTRCTEVRSTAHRSPFRDDCEVMSWPTRPRRLGGGAQFARKC